MGLLGVIIALIVIGLGLMMVVTGQLMWINNQVLTQASLTRLMGVLVLVAGLMMLLADTSLHETLYDAIGSDALGSLSGFQQGLALGAFVLIAISGVIGYFAPKSGPQMTSNENPPPSASSTDEGGGSGDQ